MRPPADLEWLPDLLRDRARRDGERTFVTFRDRALTFGAFDARTDRLAAGFAALGVRPGDVVSVFLPNCLEFLEAWWGVLKAGGVLGPVNPAYTAHEAAYVIGHSEAVAVVTDGRGAELLAGVRGELPLVREVISVDGGGDMALDELAGDGGAVPEVRRGRGDLASILYTSGTTGRPKGAMLTHGNALVNAAQGAELVPLLPGDRVGMLLPLFHANAQVVTVLLPLMIGCEVAMWERFSASTFWTTVAEQRPVTLSAVPTILAAVMAAENAPDGPTSLRYVICGAAPLSVELLAGFERRFGIRILEGYGLTETTCISSINPYYGDRRAGSIGLPIRGQEMRIARGTGAGDGDGNGDGAVDPHAAVPAGEYGEIIIRGPNVMAGYLKNEAATAEAIRDGWLHTGDVGYVDGDGYFYIVDRSKDMIIRGGENIYPREIEEVIYEFGAILECAVIGVPDPVRGEEVLAVVVPTPGAAVDLDALAAFVGERLARYKQPRRWELADELPKTPTGKISKGPLRETFGSWAAGAQGRSVSGP